MTAIISVRVHPGARKNEVLSFSSGGLEVKVAALPEKGKANKELIDFLSELLGVSKSRLTILGGQTSRSKLAAIDGLSQEGVLERLQP